MTSTPTGCHGPMQSTWARTDHSGGCWQPVALCTRSGVSRRRRSAITTTTSTPALSSLQARCPFCCPTSSVKALKVAQLSKSWFLVQFTSNTHWATQFHQLFLSSAASSTSSQLVFIFLRSFMTDSLPLLSRPIWPPAETLGFPLESLGRIL